MKKFCLLVLLSLVVLIRAPKAQAAQLPWWNVQAIDTMKYSRDPSAQYLSNMPELNKISDQMAKDISATGATHMVVDTPYDDQFLPILKVWVAAARKYNLHVWYRGNWSGWENWFGVASITRVQHIQKTKDFITKNPDLFLEGDIFTACPECENGGPGDPRLNGDVAGHRAFLINEYQMMTETFRSIGKNVQVNYNSMNGDVAQLVMDKDTTSALGGIVVIDHYVKSPADLNYDISKIAKNSGGKVILGEFGAPIPDIHGNMTDDQQAQWIKQSLNLLASNPDLGGLNYWTNMGGSTAIWTDKGVAKPAVAVITSYFKPQVIDGKVVNTLGTGIDKSIVESTEKRAVTSNGEYEIAFVNPDEEVTISAVGYHTQKMPISQLKAQPVIVLDIENPSLWFRFRTWLKNLFN
ncbi:hypothetical protein BH10PAT2_BH10PAT2_3950 [soil metagenome]